VDMKVEVVVVPVFDVDKAKDFYQALGWRLDADFVTGADFRVVQLTPPARPARSGGHHPPSGPVTGSSLVTAGRQVPAEQETPMQVTYDSAADLAEALQRAAAAHGKHEEQLGHPDPDWPDWYAMYMEQEQAGART